MQQQQLQLVGPNNAIEPRQIFDVSAWVNDADSDNATFLQIASQRLIYQGAAIQQLRDAIGYLGSDHQTEISNMREAIGFLGNVSHEAYLSLTNSCAENRAEAADATHRLFLAVRDEFAKNDQEHLEQRLNADQLSQLVGWLSRAHDAQTFALMDKPSRQDMITEIDTKFASAITDFSKRFSADVIDWVEKPEGPLAPTKKAVADVTGEIALMKARAESAESHNAALEARLRSSEQNVAALTARLEDVLTRIATVESRPAQQVACGCKCAEDAAHLMNMVKESHSSQRTDLINQCNANCDVIRSGLNASIEVQMKTLNERVDREIKLVHESSSAAISSTETLIARAVSAPPARPVNIVTEVSSASAARSDSAGGVPGIVRDKSTLANEFRTLNVHASDVCYQPRELLPEEADAFERAIRNLPTKRWINTGDVTSVYALGDLAPLARAFPTVYGFPVDQNKPNRTYDIITTVLTTYGVLTAPDDGAAKTEAKRKSILKQIDAMKALKNFDRSTLNHIARMIDVPAKAGASPCGADVIAEWAVIMNHPVEERSFVYQLIVRASVPTTTIVSQADFEAEARGAKEMKNGEGERVKLQTLNF